MFSVVTNMVLMYVDIVLLMIVLCLLLCVCTYCVVRIRRLQQSGHMTILLRPTKVMFSHKNDDNGKEELRTVVAYQNPFTGDYCVHKPRPPRGFVNALAARAPPSPSPDSGLSDEYEPLRPPARPAHYGPFNIHEQGTLRSVADRYRAFQSMGDVTQLQRAGDVTQLQRAGDVTQLQRSGDVTQLQRAGDVTQLQGAGDEERAYQSTGDVNSVNKTWNWNYKEYQI